MKKNKKKSDCGNVLMVLMIVCVVLSLTMLAIVAYDKLIKEQCQPCNCQKTFAEPWSE